MKILYISTLTSERKISKIFEQTGKNPGFAAQKFNRLLAKGFIKNECDVTCLSAMPVPPEDIKGLFVKKYVETEKGIKYIYCPFVNTNFLRKVSFLIYSFYFVLFWGLKNRKDKFVICDILNASISMGAVFASKINGLRSVGLFTDLPGMLMGDAKGSSHHIGNEFCDSRYLHWFSSYIFLTEAMAPVVNKDNRPYIIIEGLTDETLLELSDEKLPNKVIMYAGALHERYGVGMLIEAFMMIKDCDLRLYLYGSGPLDKQIDQWSKIDKRIIFKGVQPTDEIVSIERKVTLLVNPRPTKEDFTKYSFPSKNMEYMASGTPLLSTNLPGIPPDYSPYFFTVREETISGFYNALTELMAMDSDVLVQKGKKARAFVIENKNNVIQSKKVINLVQSI